jgi:AcrR family transcriptional regulator
MARVRTRPTRQDTIEQLIDGARRAFTDRGFYGARVEDICAAAGLSRGAFYSCFGKKEDLFFALYDRMTSEVRRVFEAGLNGEGSARQDPIEGLFTSLAENYPLGRDWYVLNAEFTLYAIRHASAAKLLAARRHVLRLMIMEKVGVALTRSGLQSTVPPELFARAVVALSDGGLGQSLIEPKELGNTTFIETFLAPLARVCSVPVRPERSRPGTGGKSLDAALGEVPDIGR